jgi:hydroxymethylbilane synthase
VARALASAGLETQLVPIATGGGARDKSRFVREIDEALLAGELDLAVHSAKDLPGRLPDGLRVGAVPPGEDPRDALVGGAATLARLAAGARVGTSSLRRRALVLATRPDVEVVGLRGNVDTRLRRLSEGGYDAIVLALAGMRRLGRVQGAAALDPESFVPAPGQGLLAVGARSGDDRVAPALARLEHAPSRARLEAERAVVAALGADCHTPVGALATAAAGTLTVSAFVGLPDGREWITDRVAGPDADPRRLGERLAQRMLAAGAADLLGRAALE